MAAGTVQVGPQKMQVRQKDVEVRFVPPFKETPVVVVTPKMNLEPYPEATDVFASSIFNLTQSGFTARVYRVDSRNPIGWDQNLELCWIAEEPS